MNENENISFFLQDKIEDTDIDISELLYEFEVLNTNLNTKVKNNNNNNEILNDYNISELQKICDFYDLLKNVKIAKYKKADIINAINYYESNESNSEIVNKRLKFWANMNELMQDKIMRKYIIWK